MPKVIIVVGARPNFMKAAPLLRAFDVVKNYRPHSNGLPMFEVVLVHTGQHYDDKMSKVFFETLGIRDPDYNLMVGSGSHAEQTARIMERFEVVCINVKPDLVIVLGDVNSTMACAITAKKLHIKVAHIEAGLRSGDMSMPEEINRVVTDSISDYFFITDVNAVENLKGKNHVYFVGNPMIDNLLYCFERLIQCTEITDKYVVLTLHRPENVDYKENLEGIFAFIREVSKRIKVIFPAHPRTFAKIKEFEISTEGITLCDPCGYMEFLQVWKSAVCVITDSGGLQEETTALKVPCITIREITERPITVRVGSNEVIGYDFSRGQELIDNAIKGKWKQSQIPEFWDGKSCNRIVTILEGLYE